MTRHHYIITDLFFFILVLFFLPVSSLAEKSNDNYLPEVVVIESDDTLPGKTNKIDSNILKSLPGSDTSISEASKLLPHVRTPNTEDSALNQGEILPEKISVSGGQFYENNFNLDGQRIESWFNPASDDAQSKSELPGYSTNLFTGTDILKDLIVLDSDIPAKYGGFTGGVINAQTKDPGDKFSGSAEFMTTRSEWTSFHLKDYLKYDFQNSESESKQPEFEKYNSNIFFQGPITQSSGYIFSYRNLRSEIPLYYLNSTKNQKRNLDSFFLKFSKNHNLVNKSSFSLTYTPYTADHFRKNAINSDYTIEGGGISLAAEKNINLKNSNLIFKASFTSSETKRDAPKNWYVWANTKSANWGELAGEEVSKEGGYGAIDRTENSLNFNFDNDFFKDILFLDIYHKFSSGLCYSGIYGKESRKDKAYSYYSAITDNPDFYGPENDEGSIPGEQYFSRRIAYLPYSGEEFINYFGLYLQENIYIKKFSLRCGLRTSYDDFLNNINLAPRFKITFDPLNNDKFVLHGGLNRYYSHGFLHQKLRQARGTNFFIENRTTFDNNLTPWEKDLSSPNKIYSFSNLRTPFADEFSLGLKASVLKQTDMSIKYIRKYFKDQFASGHSYDKDGYSVYQYNNSASSEYDSISFSIKKEKKENYYILFNLSWQKKTSYIDSYNSLADEETATDLVYYKGSVILKDEMPAKNYNQPIKANLIFYKRLPLEIDFTSVLKYRNSYGIISDTYDYFEFIEDDSDINPETGEPFKIMVPVYEDKKIKERLTCDVKIEAPFFKKRRYSGKVILNILNIFDNVKSLSSEELMPIHGRQLWAGLKFEF